VTRIILAITLVANAQLACLTPNPVDGDRPVQRVIQADPPEMRPYNGRIGAAPGLVSNHADRRIDEPLPEPLLRPVHCLSIQIRA
jgi:hypothetical protein